MLWEMGNLMEQRCLHTPRLQVVGGAKATKGPRMTGGDPPWKVVTSASHMLSWKYLPIQIWC